MPTSSSLPPDIAEQVITDRRHLHRHPELSYEEHATARYVAKRLGALGLEVRAGVGGTGVVGLLRGERPGKTVMLRADMDALPIQEENDVPYRSETPGVMHACGHDGHTAMLLGAARLLRERRDRLAGTIKFVFQPAEESPPGGALAMIEQGVLEDPPVDAAFGLHLSSRLPVGMVMVQPGPVNAAADTFRLEIRGKGGHAAHPHLSVDTVLVAAQVVVALHTIVGRDVDPQRAAVLTVGMLHAGRAPNIIPETALLKGTIRSFNPEVRDLLARRLEEVSRHVAQAMRAECTCRMELRCPPVVNDPAMAELVAAAAQVVAGADRVVTRDPSMAYDDVARFLERVPGCYFVVGARNEERGIVWPHHHPRFDVDEAALPIGVAVFVRLVERFLAV